MGVTSILVLFLRSVLRDRTELAAENLTSTADRHSPAEVLNASAPASRPNLMGVALLNLDRLAFRLVHRAARHRGSRSQLIRSTRGR